MIQVIDDAESPGGPAQKGIAFVGPRISYQPEILKDVTEIEQMYGAYCAWEFGPKWRPANYGSTDIGEGLVIDQVGQSQVASLETWRRLKRSP